MLFPFEDESIFSSSFFIKTQEEGRSSVFNDIKLMSQGCDSIKFYLIYNNNFIQFTIIIL